MWMDSYLKKVEVHALLESYYFGIKKNHTWPYFIPFPNNCWQCSRELASDKHCEIPYWTFIEMP